jgi:hypothetical protein
VRKTCTTIYNDLSFKHTCSDSSTIASFFNLATTIVLCVIFYINNTINKYLPQLHCPWQLSSDCKQDAYDNAQAQSHVCAKQPVYNRNTVTMVRDIVLQCCRLGMEFWSRRNNPKVNLEKHGSLHSSWYILDFLIRRKMFENVYGVCARTCACVYWLAY